MEVTEINRDNIVITGDTDDEYVNILKAVEKAICKVAPDCGVTIKVSFGIQEPNK